MSRKSLMLTALLVVMFGTSLLAWQWQGRRSRGRYSGGSIMVDRGDVPRWETDPAFVRDMFTFARIRYDSHYNGRGGDWATDFPDSDLNFSLRLQQLTSIRVNPDPVVVSLTEDKIYDYPFLYMIEPGRLLFSDEEVVALRKYCLRGGFLMVDDFWGDEEYENFHQQIKRVFPDREPKEVPLEHEIFHCVYDLKEKPQLPSIHAAYQSGGRTITWNRGTVATQVFLITKPSMTMTTVSWSSSATILIWATAGNAKARTNGTLKSSRSRKPTRSVLTS